MGRRVDTYPEALRLELRRDEGADGAFAVGTADVDRGKMRLGMAQDFEQRPGGTQAPLDPAGLTGEEKAAGVREGRPAQSAASPGLLPVVCRSS